MIPALGELDRLCMTESHLRISHCMQDLNWPPSNGFAAQLQSLRAATNMPHSGPFTAGPTAAPAPAQLSDITQLLSLLTSQQHLHHQSSVAQTSQPLSLPLSWEDARQAVSQANAQSGAVLSSQGQQPKLPQGLVTGAMPDGAVPPTLTHGPTPNEATPNGAVPNGALPDGAAPSTAGPNGTMNAGCCTGVTVSMQAEGQGQGQDQAQAQVVVQDYAPDAADMFEALIQKTAQQAEHAQQAASWYVERAPGGEWVCVMQDGAKLSLEQLYYTLEHVGESLPQDKYQALSMMIKQLTDCGEKYEAQAVMADSA